MLRHTIMAAAIALAAVSAVAENETMYLVKGDRVVAKYDVDEVDYITFNLPDDVKDQNLWLTIDKVGKNSVTYSVGTAGSDIAYAHNLLSYYDVNYTAMDMYGDMLENLDDESVLKCIQYTLASNAFVGIGSQTFTQTDFQQYDPASEIYRFSVIPGTKYYLCAWEINPQTQEPMTDFVYEELTTETPDNVDLGLNVTLAEIIEDGMVLDFTGSENIRYVRTCWGMKDQMEAYVNYYGLDFLMGTFGQNWSLEYLKGIGDFEPGVPNSTWMVYDPGEYVMYVNAYDAEGNVQSANYVFEYNGSGDTENAPVISIFSKEKSEGHVKINFEITPSNVEEAYVRLMSENMVDDRLNMGYTYPELAKGGDSTEITSEINTTGEYTFENNEVQEQWNSILIYAKSKDGGETTLRINFYPDTDSDWSIYAPFHAPKATKAPIRIKRAGCPVIRK